MANNGLGTHNKNNAVFYAHAPTAGSGDGRGDGSPRCEVILVTPEMATEWLKANTMNRKIRKSHVRTLVRDIREGRWPFNPQPISFGTDGSLLDGQHRLHAIAMAETPVQLAVWFNVPLDARRVMDTGQTRNLSDIAGITKTQAAVAQSMIRGMGGHISASMAEKVVVFNRFATEIDFVIDQMGAAPKRGIGQASVLAAIVRASFYLKASDIAHFCEVLSSGMPKEDRDATVIRLRDRLLQVRTGGGTSASEVYAYTVSALRAFSEGRALSKVYAASSDPYKLPDPTGE